MNGFDVVLRFKYPSGASKLEITVWGDRPEYQVVGYFPNGMISQTEHGTLDALIEQLSTLKKARWG